MGKMKRKDEKVDSVSFCINLFGILVRLADKYESLLMTTVQ